MSFHFSIHPPTSSVSCHMFFLYVICDLEEEQLIVVEEGIAAELDTILQAVCSKYSNNIKLPNLGIGFLSS